MAGSKAFYKSRIASRLVHEFHGHPSSKRKLQVWQTSCIVTNFAAYVGNRNQEELGTSPHRILVNPSNPELSGCRRFPYFPRGGPVPSSKVYSSVHRDWQPLGFVSSWGGMEVGKGMLYPVSVVDGLVHHLGGWKLQAEIKWLQCRSSTPCPVGSAIQTTAGNSSLAKHYDSILHTTPPFFKYNDTPETLLKSCYESTLALVHKAATTEPTMVAIPLIGAGARGFPEETAIDIACRSMLQWLQEDSAEHPIIVAIGLLDLELIEQMGHALGQSSSGP